MRLLQGEDPLTEESPSVSSVSLCAVHRNGCVFRCNCSNACRVAVRPMEVGGLFRKTKGVLYRTPFKHTRQTRNNISARPIVYETKTSTLSKFLHFVYIAFLHEGEIENVEFHISILILAFKNINIGNQSRIDISIILDFVHLAGSSWSTKVLFSKTKQKNKTKKLKGGQVTAAEPLRRKGVESREWTLQRANAYIPLDAHLRLPNHNPPTSTSFGSTSLQKPVCPVCC